MNGESGNLQQACAACKHQRKKCDENCELAQYFPASRMAEFQNAYRLFGVCNIQRLMAAVEPDQRQRAADSILMESDLRRQYPVHGSLAVIRNLNSEVDFCEQELRIANRYLDFFRQREKDRELKKSDSDSLQTEISESHLLILPDLVRSDEQGQRLDDMSSLDEEAELLGVHLQKGLEVDFDKDENLDLSAI